MKITNIISVDDDTVQVCFDGSGAIRIGESELLDRQRFLARVNSSFRGRGVDNAPPYQHEWERFVKDIWQQSNPQLSAGVQ